MLFVIGGLPKILEGGWIPLLISAIVFMIAASGAQAAVASRRCKSKNRSPSKSFFVKCTGVWGSPSTAPRSF